MHAVCIHVHACVHVCIARVRVHVWCACVHVCMCAGVQVRLYVRVYRRVQRLEVAGHPAIQRPVRPTVRRHLLHMYNMHVCMYVRLCV